MDSTKEEPYKVIVMTIPSFPYSMFGTEGEPPPLPSPLQYSPPHVPLSKHRVIVFSKDLLCLFSLAHNLWLDSERLPTVPIENGVSDLLHYFLEKPKICFLFQKKNSIVICKNEKRTNRTRLFYEILEDNP